MTHSENLIKALNEKDAVKQNAENPSPATTKPPEPSEDDLNKEAIALMKDVESMEDQLKELYTKKAPIKKRLDTVLAKLAKINLQKMRTV